MSRPNKYDLDAVELSGVNITPSFATPSHVCNDLYYCGDIAPYSIYRYKRGGQWQDNLMFEHIEHGSNDYVFVYFNEDREVYDYDGCFDIPFVVREWLAGHGFDLSEVTSDE